MRLPEDTFKHQGLRKRLVSQLKEKGISDEKVLEAMTGVPRHFFFDKAFLSQAYSDQAFRIGAGQTISQPYTVAFQTSLLQLTAGDKVLEIGTGSGYQTCILLELDARVFSIERQKELYDTAGKRLSLMGYAPRLFFGNGYEGLPGYSPFDRVLITCGAPSVPVELVRQMRIGGVMVAPIGAGDVQVMMRITKTSETETETETFSEFRFVPMLENKEWGDKKDFVPTRPDRH